MENLKAEAVEALIKKDPYLASHRRDIELRIDNYAEKKKSLLGSNHGSLSDFANAHLYYGFHQIQRDGRKGWIYREWAPAAHELFLTGDFNDWNRSSHPLTRNHEGNWEIWIPDDSRQHLEHGQLLKVHIHSDRGAIDRIPLYIHVVRKEEHSHDFRGQLWSPANPYSWHDENFSITDDFVPLIYEAHVGMAQEKYGIGTYREFTENILPMIKESGYNTVQLMGIMEHPYYASFGYQVSNFYAASSRFGDPEDLKALIDRAHELGILVLMDLVHSHAVKNVNEGINEFDGTEYQFFHSGTKGVHPDWDTKIFNYGKPEVINFLLSNLKYWIEEYHFDGFRFDGVTSMLYHDRGRDSFHSYNQYFNMNVDTEAVTYLQLACELIRELKSRALIIAEDMSGMPGMALPLNQGEGIGFDARLSMGIPDLWMKLLKIRDEEWSMKQIWQELTGRRPGEKTIAYAESHDQALVGDKTIAHWLMDKSIYFNMTKEDPSMEVDRGMALHKMIRLITFALGGDGYLNFMGNEFGHPEWIDFPTHANQWSYHYARRQWSLAENPELKYQYLRNFDRSMLGLANNLLLLNQKDITELYIDEGRKILAFSRGSLLFLFNFHPNYSEESFEFPCRDTGPYREVLNTDQKDFGGQGRIESHRSYEAAPSSLTSFGFSFRIYSPSRTALVLAKNV